MSFGKAGNTILLFFSRTLPRFFTENFEITSTKKSKIICTVICAVKIVKNQKPDYFEAEYTEKDED